MLSICKYLAFLFNFKQKEEPEPLPLLPEPIVDVIKTREEQLIAMLKHINEREADPELIELQVKLLEEEYLKDGRKVEIFHKMVVELKNNRLEDENLDTQGGTRRALHELSIYANKIGEFKYIKVQDPKVARKADEIYYWSI